MEGGMDAGMRGRAAAGGGTGRAAGLGAGAGGPRPPRRGGAGSRNPTARSQLYKNPAEPRSRSRRLPPAEPRGEAPPGRNRAPPGRPRVNGDPREGGGIAGGEAERAHPSPPSLRREPQKSPPAAASSPSPARGGEGARSRRSGRGGRRGPPAPGAAGTGRGGTHRPAGLNIPHPFPSILPAGPASPPAAAHPPARSWPPPSRTCCCPAGLGWLPV